MNLSRTNLSRMICAAVTVAPVIGCSADSEDTPHGVASTSQQLYGDLTTSSCSTAHQNVLTQAHAAGKVIAGTLEFEACLHRRMTYFYMPCLDGSGDPFGDQSRATQFSKLRDITQSGNLADVAVTCADLPERQGEAGIGGYRDALESITVDRGMLDEFIASPNEFKRSDVASIIWHEAMHQQGYRHSENDEEPGTGPRCGYSEAQYSRGANSAPYITDRCIRSAGSHSRVIAFNSAGVSQSFGLGRHRASEGAFATVGNDSIVRLRVPPAGRVRYCADEGESGLGTRCQTVANTTIEYGGLYVVPETSPGISFLEVEPTALVFNAVDFGGTVQALRYGEHRANAGDLATVGNDAIRSIYVPPGMRVRVCAHENGPTGHGLEPCAVYDQPVASVWLGGISYAEVVPVVTAYHEPDFFGARQSFGAGRHIRRDGGLAPLNDGSMVSLLVPPGLQARLCTDVTASDTGTGTCRTLSTSDSMLSSDIARRVFFLEVTPNVLGTANLTIQRQLSNATGTVRSVPVGINCGPQCTAPFHARSDVRLVAVPGANSTVEWVGCDSVSGTSCRVRMMNARTVTARFVAHQCVPSCPNTCRRASVSDGCGGFCPANCSSNCCEVGSNTVCQANPCN
jgi:hypothetical protein